MHGCRPLAVLCHQGSGCIFGIRSVNTSPRGLIQNGQAPPRKIGLSRIHALSRRACPAPSSSCTGRAGAPHRHRITRRCAAGRRVAPRPAHGARGRHGEWQDDTRTTHRPGHHRIAWLGGLHRRPTYPRRTRLDPPRPRGRDVHDSPPRSHARRLVRRHPASQQRLCARGARWRTHALQGRRRAPHGARARVQRRPRPPWRPRGSSLAARWRRAPGCRTTKKAAV
jgi:hypothetical protein